ncbi:hypothetical protein GCM10009038_29470 [Salinicola rhizosphaerae]|uniref:Alpha/beta hydrolase n=1 Tax=Salinicola rhizosphaerae TaxID=1443141 RepID=A0ABQ3EF22_9GAMM|nr:hypothetical protein GCM10009038_29470 [Salinicola rhizosphaerae]
MTLAGSEQWTLHGEATNRDYLIQVAVPDSPPPPGGYPVVYMLDGNSRFPLAVVSRDSLTLRGPYDTTEPWLIVGIGYPDVERFGGDARSEDYTPPGGKTGCKIGCKTECKTEGNESPARETGARCAQRPSGGADRFLDVIADQIQPAVAERYAVDGSRQALVGHSFGGLLTLYALLTRPALFSDYVAISPSLWWHGGEPLRSLVALDGDEASRRVLIGVGDKEAGRRPRLATVGKDEVHASPAIDAAGLAEALVASHPNWTIASRTFHGAGHGTVMWPAMQALWQFLDVPPQQ